MLTGGASTRMGCDKARLTVQGQPLAERIAGQLGRLGIPVTVLGNAPIEGHQFLADVASYEGPPAALARFVPSADAVFVSACDLVRFDERVVDLLAGLLGSEDAAIPEVGGRMQPLCALYRASAWQELSAALEAGNRSMMAWVDRLDVRMVSESELANAGLDPRCPLGVNTQEELELALSNLA